MGQIGIAEIEDMESENPFQILIRRKLFKVYHDSHGSKSS
jgi:hypothetical protein